ncbi:hypothetical protein Taro_029444 [Colocasia esculenta]|uniref:Uncharacterized protein n=1 Tax=Colocasia esculenta TaxID=4460 RepID=A0A843VR60_COLES|nr:hypothetical protein [Colocasia esculenta]
MNLYFNDTCLVHYILKKWSHSVHPFVQTMTLMGVGRVLNATALVVTFMLPLFGLTSACAPHVACGAGLADVRSGKETEPQPNRAWRSSARPGEAAARVSWRFEVLVEFSACSRREDVVWSGGNAEGSSVFTFIAKIPC